MHTDSWSSWINKEEYCYYHCSNNIVHVLYIIETSFISCLCQSVFILNRYDWWLFTVYLCTLSHFSPVWLCATLWTVAARFLCPLDSPEYWSGLPCCPPEDLLDPGIKPLSLKSPALEGRFFIASTTWEALSLFIQFIQQTLMEVLLRGQYHVMGTEADNLGSNILTVT